MSKSNTDIIKRPRVWAVGAGKGGSGKSVIAANMGALLARQGYSCALIDLDLGGANLHTILGISTPSITLADFFLRKCDDLEDIITRTSIPGLYLISGSPDTTTLRTPKFTQKEKLLRRIASLDVDIVIMDIGAGTQTNVIDFFLGADQGIMVVVPEPTSVENAYQFMRASLLRKLTRSVDVPGVRSALDRVIEAESPEGFKTAGDLISAVNDFDPNAARSLIKEARRFNPLILVNQVRTEIDRRLGAEMQAACRDYFGAQFRFIGELPNDDMVRSSVQVRMPLVEAFPTSEFKMALDIIINRLVGADEAKYA